MPSLVFFNAQIHVEDTQRIPMMEMCLSVANLCGLVYRPNRILIRYLDEEARPRAIRASGVLAAILQHEYDHLVGKLFLDRMTRR
mmetsp:Transcript_40275/g.101391  ORF Transcript_40275/g.101391 Transcript_40275/m.101391 type:complete len:85 (-) Transcript_40275:264-518(-)